MRIVVVGRSGQLATELRRVALPTSLQLLPAEKVELADRLDTIAMLDRSRPDLVINAAAYTAVDRAEDERARAFAVNESGPRLLATWCQANGAPLIHVSTDYVFDGSKQTAYTEDDPTRALNTYGASKLAGEVAIRAELARHVILRTSWVFSAHGQNFVKTMLRLARERDELRVVSDQWGRPTAAADLARVIVELAARLSRGEQLSWGSYHFAGGEPGRTSWHGFAEAIVEEQSAYTHRRPRVVPITTADYPTPAVRPMNSELDSARFFATFGISPASWRSGLHSVVEELARSEATAPPAER